MGRVELPRVSSPDPKSGASANSATFARSIGYLIVYHFDNPVSATLFVLSYLAVMSSFQLALLASPLFLTSIIAQPSASPTDATRIRTLAKAAPRLPLELSELKLLPPREIGFVSSVASDRQGNFYLLQRDLKSDHIIVIDKTGKILRSWGKGLFTIPHSIRLDPSGNVWTTDANTSMVYQFTPNGRKLLEINVGGQPASITSEFRGTTDTAFGPNGHVYISDGYGNARILEYDKNGKKIRQWGKAGNGPGEFRLPHGIAVHPNGNVYVADRENDRVQWFNSKGEYLGEWNFAGRVFTLAFTPKGDLFVSAQPRDVPLGAEGWLFKVNQSDGSILGRVDGAGHSLTIAPNGSIVIGKRPDHILLFSAK